MISGYTRHLTPSMRRISAVLLLLSVWLHATFMVPAHRHAQAVACAPAVGMSLAAAPDAGPSASGWATPTAHNDDCPEHEAACVWCAWAQLAHAMAPVLQLPPALAAQPNAPQLGTASRWCDAEGIAVRARGPPQGHVA